MTRFLAIIRRFFLGGIVSLVLCLCLFGIKFTKMVELTKAHNSIAGYSSLFFLLSPIFFLLFTIISVIYIRMNGQFAAFHQTQSPMVSFFRCLGHDLRSPFKNIFQFFCALFNKNAIGRGILIIRFFELLVLVLLCFIGIRSLL